MIFDEFKQRHIGPSPAEQEEMLQAIGIDSLEQLIGETVPEDIRLKDELDQPEAESEYNYLNRLRTLAEENEVFTSCIGQGYYNCITPSVILRNVLENPGWYTPYTPYQAEIAQGRLEAL
ncbi:MAG: glycine dehydrogenase (aminomethyl-transferring), partial [Verrucomicrobiota bacterium]